MDHKIAAAFYGHWSEKMPFALYYAYSRRAFPIIIADGFFDVYGMLWPFTR